MPGLRLAREIAPPRPVNPTVRNCPTTHSTSSRRCTVPCKLSNCCRMPILDASPNWILRTPLSTMHASTKRECRFRLRLPPRRRQLERARRCAVCSRVAATPLTVKPPVLATSATVEDLLFDVLLLAVTLPASGLSRSAAGRSTPGRQNGFGSSLISRRSDRMNCARVTLASRRTPNASLAPEPVNDSGPRT
jgi:hypothetical protein